jgi:hypothetical protein
MRAPMKKKEISVGAVGAPALEESGSNRKIMDQQSI